MSEQAFYYVQMTSTLSVALPLTLGVIRFRGLELPIRRFVLFLAVGFIVDLSGWYFFLTQNGAANEIARHGYDLFEAVFLLWIVARLSRHRLLNRSFTWLVIPLLAFWASRFYDRDLMSAFKSATQILYAFTASYVILRMIEKETAVTRVLAFWILLGIFFYCFCTYFIMGLLSTQLSRAWYMHNIINILTNVIYFFGFIRATDAERHSSAANF